MKRIPLTQGKFAIVDDEDYEKISQYKWYAYWNSNTKSFYARRQGKRENHKQPTISMAREVLGFTKDDKRQPDHINHNTLDNRSSNLRAVTNQQNHFNQKNTKGYVWNKRAKKYYAQIGFNYRTIFLGSFDTAWEARNAYLQAKKIYHPFKNTKVLLDA